MITKTNGMKLFKKADKIIQKFYNEHGYDPSLEEVSEILKKDYNIEVKDLSDLYDLNMTSISTSIDDDFTVEESDEYNAKTAYQNDYEEEIDREYSKTIANKFLSLVPIEQREIIKRLYGIGYDRQYSVSEVAQMYKMTPEDMTKLQNNILEYMRQNMSQFSAAI